MSKTKWRYEILYRDLTPAAQADYLNFVQSVFSKDVHEELLKSDEEDIEQWNEELI